MSRSSAAALGALALALGAAGCGGGDESTGETTRETTLIDTTMTEPGSPEAGQALFVDRCGTCHTLPAAGTTVRVGPDLDELTLTTGVVEEQVRNGSGAMPAFDGDLSEHEIADVSAYVAAEAGQG